MLLSQLTVHRKKRANNTEIRRKLQMTYTKVAAHILTISGHIQITDLLQYDAILQR